MNRSQGVNGLAPVSIGEPDKVTSWPFKEPDKKTSWKDEERAGPPRDVPIELRDHEMDKAIKRTAEIRTLMSPPGTLGLPPLLEEARIKWGIPDGAFDCQAVFDRIHIFPIDFEGQKDTYGNTSIHRGEVTKMRDTQNGHRGILISMGLSAMDQCSSHGVEVGHIVRTIRNAPHAQECARISFGPIFYLVMRAGDLTGSETQAQELRAGNTRIMDEGGEHTYSFQVQGKKKIVAHIRDQW